MTTMSYVQAVKMAVLRMQNSAYTEDNGWYWANKWRRYMTIRPVLTNYNEI